MSTAQQTKTLKTAQSLLRYVKVPGTYKGFKQLATSIELAAENEDRLLNVTIDLYPLVAEIHHTTSSCVQKNLRKAISTCWKNGGREQMETLLELSFEKRPYTKDFIDLLADYLRKTQE